jgi:HSP20 family protein
MSQKQPTSAAPEAAASREQARPAIAPRVDVRENAEGITLLADLPGVASDGLNVQVDKDSLLIEGEVSIRLPDGMQAVHAELRGTLYRRSFALSSELDTGGIDAVLRNGVLQLHIPKRAEVRPRRVEVRID